MQHISQFFYKNANLKLAILLTAILGAYLALVMTPQAANFETSSGNIKSLGMSFGFSENDILTFFQLRTENMLSAYINFNLIWDSIFALIYGVMYAVWLSLLLKAYSEKARVLNLIPFLQVIFDWTENYSLGYLADRYLNHGTIDSNLAILSSYAAMLKWLCSGLTYAAIIVGITYLLVRIVKKN